jgi:hypothetical protein
MMMGLVTLLVVLSVPLTGGHLRRLLDLPIRAAWLLPIALFLQVLVINIVPTAPEPIPVLVHLATYLMAAVFLWRNRRIPGLPILAFGAAMNGLTIALNGGSLPASAAALRRAGWSVDPGDFTNSAVLAHPHLAWLGDNFAIPSSVPFANVFSLGDLVILLGALVILHRGSRVAPAQPADQTAGRAADQETGQPVGQG